MNIYFKTKKIEKIFNSNKLLNKEYGELAKAIQRRMAVLDSSSNLAEVPFLPPERCHALIGNKKNEFAVDISRNDRLIFMPKDKIQLNENKEVIKEEIKDIIILRVEDYH